MKKFFTIFFIVLTLLAIIYFVWFFFFKKPNQIFPFIPSTNTLTIGGNIFNQNNQAGDSNQNQNGEVTQTENDLPTQSLFQIWDKPTAGFAFVQTPILLEATTTDKKGKEIIIQKRATTTSLIFADRMTGHIYKKDLPTGEIYKVSNSTLPGIYDAYFFENGNYIMMRYLNNKTNKIESILAKVPQSYTGTVPQALENLVSLPQNISSVAVSLSGKEISYLVPNTDGSVIYSYTLKKVKGKADVGTVSSRLSLKTKEWNLIYGGETLYAQSSPTAYISGYFIKVDTNERIIGDKTGLTILPDSKDTNYFGGMWTDSGLASFIFSRTSGSTVKTTQKTLPEKCVWGYSNKNILCAVPDSLPWSVNGMPDDWYQGRVSFKDSLYILSGDGLYGRTFFDLSYVSKKDIDATSLQINNSSEYLGFINKKEGDLWLLLTKDILNSIGFGL